MGLEDELNNELLDDIDELVGQGSLEEGHLPTELPFKLQTKAKIR